MKKVYMMKLTIVTLIISVISIGTFQIVQGKTFNRPDMESDKYFYQPINEDKDNKEVIELNINDVIISEDVQEKIKKSDSKNSIRNINNYKQIIVELNIHEEYQKEIERLIGKYEIEDIFIAYEFLHDNYGKIYELEEILQENKSGKDWGIVFQEYLNRNKEYEPSDYSTEYLEDLLKDPSISYDDIMIADRIASMNWINIDVEDITKYYKKENSKSSNKSNIDLTFISEIKNLNQADIFQKLIDMKREGASWEEIKNKFGILNIEESLTTITLDSREISVYQDNTNLSKEAIIEVLVLAKKHEFKEDEVIMSKESGNSKSDIYKKYLTKKYSE